MKHVRNILLFLVSWLFIPSPQVAALDWSYGIKAGGTTAHATLNQIQKNSNDKLNRRGLWHPGLSAALYAEYRLNPHIGLASELLYDTFGFLQKWHEQIPISGKRAGQTFVLGSVERVSQMDVTIHTIGIPLLVKWSCTAIMGPDFEEDYFRGTLFLGLHPFMCIKGTKDTVPYLTLNNTPIWVPRDRLSSPQNQHATIVYDTITHRLKCGFIGGIAFEWLNGFLLELRCMTAHNLHDFDHQSKRRLFISHNISLGYNFSRFYT